MQLRRLLLISAAAPIALAQSYVLSHRFVPAPITTADIPFIPYSELSHNLSTRSIIADGERSTVQGSSEGWYQITLEGEGGGPSLMASTRACYITQGSNPVLEVNTFDERPYSISIRPQASTNPCSSTSKVSLPNSIAVDIKRPVLAVSPELTSAVPITLTATGAPAPPPVEKTFLQKYWLPLIGVAFFLISQMAPGEERPRAQA